MSDEVTFSMFEPEVGKTYIENEPYRAPEALGVFRCLAVDTVPGTDLRVAFGFGTVAYPGTEWTPALLQLSSAPADKWMVAVPSNSHGWQPGPQ
jgi:hypothetical protein